MRRRRGRNGSNSNSNSNSTTGWNPPDMTDRGNNNNNNNDNDTSDAASTAGGDRKQTKWRSLCCCVALAIVVVIVSVIGGGIVVLVIQQNANRLPAPPPTTSTTTTTTTRDDSNASPSPESPPATTWGRYEWMETIAHDPTAFTQGLLTVSYSKNYANDNSSNIDNIPDNDLVFCEGTGMHGASQLRLLNATTGALMQHIDLGASFFGEGIAHYYHREAPMQTTNKTSQSPLPKSLRLIQLTWQERTAFEYSVATWDPSLNNDESINASSNGIPWTLSPPLLNWTFETTTNEGWGITYVPTKHEWIVSDGSNVLHVWNVDTRQELRRIPIFYQTDQDKTPRPMNHLNELEWDPVTETVLANVWMSDLVARIDPVAGMVRTFYDLKALFPNRPSGADVLNGIALTYDSSRPENHSEGLDVSTSDQVWVTGKYWPYMFRIRLID